LVYWKMSWVLHNFLQNKYIIRIMLYHAVYSDVWGNSVSLRFHAVNCALMALRFIHNRRGIKKKIRPNIFYTSMFYLVSFKDGLPVYQDACFTFLFKQYNHSFCTIVFFFRHGNSALFFITRGVNWSWYN